MAPKKALGDKFAPKELVLAKMPGFPAWPSFVMPQAAVPDAIMKAKKKTTDYCVIFIPDGDFYWMNEKNLELLPRDMLEKKLEKVTKPIKKSKNGRVTNVGEALLAAKGLAFDTFMKRLENIAGGGNEDDEDEEEEADEEAEEEDDEEEKEDYEEENGDSKDIEEDAKPTEHTKSNPDNDNNANETEKAVPAPEPAAKPKRTTVGPKGHRKRAKTTAQPVTPPKTDNNNVGHKKSGASESLNDDDKQHQLWLCRIKLQRSLIQRNQPVTPEDPSKFPQPTADELAVARLILHRLVDFPVTVELLKQTKIHKVLKCILRDDTLEYADSFKLHEKCEELLDKWADLIETIKVDKATKLLSGDSNSKDGTNGTSANNTAITEPTGEESEISAVDKTETVGTLKFGEVQT